jgi:hypothetical protein
MSPGLGFFHRDRPATLPCMKVPLFEGTYKIICVRTRKMIVDYFEVEFDD